MGVAGLLSCLSSQISLKSQKSCPKSLKSLRNWWRNLGLRSPKNLRSVKNLMGLMSLNNQKSWFGNLKSLWSNLGLKNLRNAKSLRNPMGLKNRNIQKNLQNQKKRLSIRHQSLISERVLE